MFTPSISLAETLIGSMEALKHIQSDVSCFNNLIFDPCILPISAMYVSVNIHMFI